MLRALIVGLALLHLGPGLAFALLAFGCEGATPFLESVCESNVFSSFARLTVGGWLILGLGLAAGHLVKSARRTGRERIGIRVWSLLALIALGASVGSAGAWLTGSEYWFLAIPVSVATGWMFLANPSACRRGERAVPVTGGSGVSRGG